MTAALYFHPNGYSTSGPKLMGRQAAGESFLAAYLRYTRGETFWIEVDDPAHAEAFRAIAAQYGRSEEVKLVTAATRNELRRPGIIYYPQPSLGPRALERSFFGHAAWSLCGVTHTTASAGAMDSITGLLTAPVQPWDALICTSPAVRANVEVLLERERAALEERLGATRFPLPLLPVIPLGIDTALFTPRQGARAAARRALGIGEDAIVVLFMGRLSFHAKAHPLPMMRALEEASAATGKPVVLVQCGWFANKAIADMFAEAAAAVAPSLRLVTLDGRKKPMRDAAWASADVFCSLSDNIQETFGITPIEAMAAGLPVVISDWDGYRTSVDDGVEGFRIPTIMPPPGTGLDFAYRHASGIDSYDTYCGHTSALVSVDPGRLREAFVRLFSDAGLRRRMGETGQRRAARDFDWSVLMPRYGELWEEQRRLREAAAAEAPPKPAAWPARGDPFTLFAAYPTVALGPNTVLRIRASDPRQEIERLLGLRMISYAGRVIPHPEDMAAICRRLSKGEAVVTDLLAEVPVARRHRAFRGLAWMLKMGVLALSRPTPVDADPA